MSFAITGPPPVVVGGLSTSSAQPLAAGSAHTWTASASGGIAPLQYQFWRRDPDGWKMVLPDAAVEKFARQVGRGK